MRHRENNNWLYLTVVGLCTLIINSQLMADDTGISGKISLPGGFKISVFANVPSPRSMAVDKDTGQVYVGTRQGSLFVVSDTNKDGVAEQVTRLGQGWNMPNGVALENGNLYVAEIHRISKIPHLTTSKNTRALPLEVIKSGLPNKRHHGWRYLKFGPDGKLYVAIGTPHNIGMPDGLEGTILRMDSDGSQIEIVARGVRNSVGFDFHPVTGELFFTDNGADGMGDDIPPDELNHVTLTGQHFGYPYTGGKSIKLSGYEDQSPPADWVGPVIEFQAHTASIGMTFYRGNQFPAEYRHDAFVAQHGSWNRSIPVGYRIMRIKFNDLGQAIDKEVFADGWLTPNGVIGRPADIAELADGSLLVSDDYADVIYRIRYDN